MKGFKGEAFAEKLDMRTLITCTILALLFTSCTSKKTVEFDFSPPLKDVAVEANELSIDPTKSQLVHFDNGTSIDVPKDAFIDEDGNVVTEPVTLALTNYNDPAAILASGIPMAYHDGEQQQDFESAGMFQIKGFAGGKEVMIQEGKELGINYPSATAGEYDFFYLEENEEDGTKKAAWKKLNSPDEQDTEAEPTPAGLGDYQLQFDTESYPELAELQSIQWRVASEHGNPLDKENAWVLDKKWASVALSQPKYGYGELIRNIPSYQRGFCNSRICGKDSNRILFHSKKSLRIFDLKGSLIGQIQTGGSQQVNLNLLVDGYIITQGSKLSHLYDCNGQHLFSVVRGFRFRIFNSGESLVFRDWRDPSKLHIYDMAGQKISEIETGISSIKAKNSLVKLYDTTETSTLTVNTMKGVALYSSKGAFIKLKKGQYEGVRYIDPENLLILEKDGRLTIWNHKVGTEVTSKSILRDSSQTQSDYLERRVPSKVKPKHNLIIINDLAPIKSVVWNYKKNQVTELDFRTMTFESDSVLSSSRFLLAYGYNYEKEISCVYDLIENRPIVEFQDPFNNSGQNREYWFKIKLNKSQSAFLLESRHYIQLYDISGTLIKDFTAYDSSIVDAQLTQNGNILSLSLSGILGTWNSQGQLLTQKQLIGFEPIFAGFWKNRIFSFSSNYHFIKMYDLSGNLQFHSLHGSIAYDRLLFSKPNPSSLNMYKTIVVPERSYQLVLDTDSDQFITYCYLSQEDQEKLDRYNTVRTQRLNAEKDRQKKEAAVVRSFAIKNFGIYNWDRFYKDESRVRIAASFDFGVPTDFNNITVFLITEINGTSVIKFYDGSWDKFSIDPKVNNQLLAVLPENKVAYLGYKDLKQLDWAAIEKNGKHKFQMKVSEEPISSLLELNEVIN